MIHWLTVRLTSQHVRQNTAHVNSAFHSPWGSETSNRNGNRQIFAPIAAYRQT